MMWGYYRFTKDDKTKIRYRPEYEKNMYEKEGYKVEELKPKRYNDKTFKRIVKKVLKYTAVPLGTTELWKKCLDCELLLTRETFLKRLRKLDDNWLQLDDVGGCYLWSCRDDMSDKRYILKKTNAISSNYPTGKRVYDTLLKKELYAFEIVDLLNTLAEERDYWKEN